MPTLDEGATERRPKAHAFHFALWRESQRDARGHPGERSPAGSGPVLNHPHYPQRWKVFTEECAELFDAIRERDVVAAGEVGERQMVNARATSA